MAQAKSARDAVEASSTWDWGLKDSWEAYEANANVINAEGFVD